MFHHRFGNATHISLCKFNPVEVGEREKQTEQHPHALNPKHPWGLDWPSPSKKRRVYLHYILSFLANHVKSDPIKNQLVLQMHYLNKLKSFDVIEESSSNTQRGCPWMQAHMLYIDHQRLIWICFYFPLDIITLLRPIAILCVTDMCMQNIISRT